MIDNRLIDASALLNDEVEEFKIAKGEVEHT